MMRRLIVLMIVLLGLPAEYASAGGATGSISGAIFHDVNGDGVRSGQEPGLGGREVTLERADGPPLVATTTASGAFRFDELVAGSYTVQADPNEIRTECDETPFLFNPYVEDYCIEVSLPWIPTGQDALEVELSDGGSVQRNIGARPADIAVLGGIALLEDRRAPEGTLIEAVFNGQECGVGQTTAATTGLNFVIDVLGAGERAGCPAPGDSLRFRVGGLSAPEVRFYEPFSSTLGGGGLQTQPLTAIREHSWLWAERRATEHPPPGTVLEALVDGVVCGEVEVEYIGGEAGFSSLLVASDELIDGCGRDATEISFRTESLDGAITLPWEVDVREMEPRLFGDVNCNYGASAVDALLMLQVVSDLRTGFPCAEGADVSRSGATDVIDAALVLQFSAGMIQQLPVA